MHFFLLNGPSHIEPPVSIKAETLLYSRNFLPLAGVQLAALESKEDEELDGNATLGSCQA
jgi:hypothetical protein